MAEVQELVRSDAAVSLSNALSATGVEAGKQFVARFPRAANATEHRQQRLNWNAPHPVMGCAALKSSAELSGLWAEHQGAIADLPTVDFEKSMVLAVFAGAGFFREVPSIERVKVLADEVVVYVSRFSRPWSKHNAKAVIEVPRTELPVRFVYLS